MKITLHCVDCQPVAVTFSVFLISKSSWLGVDWIWREKSCSSFSFKLTTPIHCKKIVCWVTINFQVHWDAKKSFMLCNMKLSCCTTANFFVNFSDIKVSYYRTWNFFGIPVYLKVTCYLTHTFLQCMTLFMLQSLSNPLISTSSQLKLLKFTAISFRIHFCGFLHYKSIATIKMIYCGNDRNYYIFSKFQVKM
jgi:hypothetical protein